MAGGYDGLLVVSLIPPDEEVRRLSAGSIPCVLIDAHHDGLPSVVIDDIAGGELATKYLLELGHRRIAFIGDKPADPFRFQSTRDRTIGYERALETARLIAANSPLAVWMTKETMWQTIDAGGLFTFRLPKGFVKTDMIGVENYLGDALDFVTHIRNRVLAYVAFGKELRQYLAEQVAFLTYLPGNSASDHQRLSRDHLPHHAAGAVGRAHQNRAQPQLVRRDYLQTAE